MASERRIFSASEIVEVGALALAEDDNGASCHSLGAIFRRAASEAHADGEELKAQICLLLAQPCELHFKPGSSEAYGPMWVMDGKRSAIPSDFKGKQSSEFEALLPHVKSAPLRARLADVVWLNNRASRANADLAVEAYVAVARGLLDGELRSELDSDRAISHEARDALKRACAIHFAVSKADERLPALDALIVEMLDKAEIAQDLYGFRSMAQLSFRYSSLSATDLAERAYRLAELCKSSGDPLAVKEVYEFAKKALAAAGDEERSRACAIEAAEQMVRMADNMSASAMACSSWLMDAIDAFRRIKGTKDRRRELEVRLREAQADIFDEMGTLSSEPVDLSELANSTITAFRGLSLGEIIGGFADLTQSRSLDELTSEALETAERSPLQAIISGSMVDRDGKVVAHKPGASSGGEPTQEWLMHQFSQSESIRRGIFVAGQLTPLRRDVVSRLDIGDRHFLAVSYHSPFVSQGFESIFAAGFTALWHGDMLSAAYQIIPQIENGLRNILKAASIEPNQIKSDLTQEDANLTAMLDRHRAALDDILGPDLCLEIDLLFNNRAGPALRHECAHGKIDSSRAFSADVVYACWLIYRLTLLPLFPHWGVVKDALDRLD